MDKNKKKTLTISSNLKKKIDTSSISSLGKKSFSVEKKKSFYNLKSIEVIGLDNTINLEIEKNLSFLKNTNIFFIDREILKDQISKYNYIENYV